MFSFSLKSPVRLRVFSKGNLPTVLPWVSFGSGDSCAHFHGFLVEWLSPALATNPARLPTHRGFDARESASGLFFVFFEGGV